MYMYLICIRVVLFRWKVVGNPNIVLTVSARDSTNTGSPNLAARQLSVSAIETWELGSFYSVQCQRRRTCHFEIDEIISSRVESPLFDSLIRLKLGLPISSHQVPCHVIIVYRGIYSDYWSTRHLSQMWHMYRLLQTYFYKYTYFCRSPLAKIISATSFKFCLVKTRRR